MQSTATPSASPPARRSPLPAEGHRSPLHEESACVERLPFPVRLGSARAVSMEARPPALPLETTQPAAF
jgi:hypothetical protein